MSLFKSIFKIAKTYALPIAAAYFGGPLLSSALSSAGAGTVTGAISSGIGSLLTGASGSLVSSALVGGAAKALTTSKPKTVNAMAATGSTAQGGVNPQSTAAAIDPEEERRRRLIAMNASGGKTQFTPAGGVSGAATVGRKSLFGQ